MAQDPGQSYSIASRLTCAKCGGTPKILSAEGRDPVIVTATCSCHGKKETKSIAKQELIFQQYFFEGE